MYVFFMSLLIFVSLCVASLFTTYVFTVLSRQSGRHPEPSINNVVMVQFQLLTTTVTDAIGDMISGVTDTGFGFASNIFQNAKQLLQLLIVALILLEISGNTNIVLRTGDPSWRCIVQPLFQNVQPTYIYIHFLHLLIPSFSRHMNRCIQLFSTKWTSSEL